MYSAFTKNVVGLLNDHFDFGLIYFKIDPAVHQHVNLLDFHKGVSKSSPPDLTFPFKIVN